MTKNIRLAKYAGFCYGVKRAVETTKKLKSDNVSKKIWVLGELIHNSNVIKELEQMGIMTVDELPENERGICVIRSHGISPLVLNDVEKKGFEVIDLTCPDVKKVQQKAIQVAQEGYMLIILGKPEHPEVLAIKANAELYSDKVFVVQDLSDLKLLDSQIKEHKKIGVVIQTTQKIELLQEVIAYLLPIVQEMKIFNTICPSTSLRQKEAKKLAEESDLMIVVGSKKSANTTHLAEILSSITKTIHIETEEELKDYAQIINVVNSISVTAGASTPEYIINNVISELKKY